MVELYKKSLSINMELKHSRKPQSSELLQMDLCKTYTVDIRKILFPLNSPRIAFGYRNTILRLFGS